MNNTNEAGKQNEETKNNVWESGELDKVEYIKFDAAKDGEVVVTILDNFPAASKNKFGAITYDFEVYEESSQSLRCLSVTSMRLMRKLKAFIPLEGKKFSIKRCGEAMNTDYNVTLVAE